MMSKLIDTINKFKGEYESDIEFDEFTLSEMLLKIPSLKSKWAAYLSIHEAELAQMKRDRDDLLEKLSSLVESKSERPLPKSSAENKARKLSKYRDFNNEVKDMESIVQFLERIHTNMQSITWEMKNVIENSKLEKF